MTASGDLEGELQAVVGEADVGWQLGLGGVVVEVVADVGEEGAPGLELLDDSRANCSRCEWLGCGWRRRASRMRMSRS